MDFDFTTEEKGLFKALRGALDGLDDEGRGLERLTQKAAGARLREVSSALAQTAYLRLGIEGSEPLLSAPAMVGAMEIFSARSPSMFLAVEASVRLFGRAVSTFGDEEQRERWLEPVLGGDSIGALGLTEASINVVNDPLETEGERLGDAVMVTGRKGMVINAPVADVLAIVGQLDEGLALFLVKTGVEGLQIEPRLETAAYGGAVISAVELESCLVADVLGPRPVEEVLVALKSFEDQILTAASLGQMKRSFELARKHAKTHKTLGGKPIIAFQEVSFPLAEMLTLYQTAQLLAFRAAWATQSGAEGAQSLSDCAKVFCTESAEQVASMALSVLGAEGLGRDHYVEGAVTAAKFGQVAGTSSELARVRLGDGQLTRWS